MAQQRGIRRSEGGKQTRPPLTQVGIMAIFGDGERSVDAGPPLYTLDSGLWSDLSDPGPSRVHYTSKAEYTSTWYPRARARGHTHARYPVPWGSRSHVWGMCQQESFSCCPARLPSVHPRHLPHTRKLHRQQCPMEWLYLVARIVHTYMTTTTGNPSISGSFRAHLEPAWPRIPPNWPCIREKAD